MRKIFHHPFFIRLLHWEYWSFGAVYIWVLPAWIYFCIRARSFFFFVASNPSIKNGGLFGESKKDIHAIMPENLYPKTIHFPQSTDPDTVLAELNGKQMRFPMIGKPDIGGKGRGVKVLRSPEEVKEYTLHSLLDFHIQEFVEYPLEAGIFYYRYPGQEKGRISGIVSKQFLTVKGNGKDDLLTLIQNDSRGIMYLKSLEKMNRDKLDRVLQDGEEMIVSPYGNHARGSMFLDCSHWNDPELEARFDEISRQVEDLYFARFDIRYRSWEELKKGRSFIIIEINGAGAEPTHMYDPGHSIFFAWKEIVRHWNILEKISRLNHKRGVPYLNVREGIRIFREEKEDSRKLAAMTE